MMVHQGSIGGLMVVSMGFFWGSLGGHTSSHHAVYVKGVGGSQQQAPLADLLSVLLSALLLQRLQGLVQGGEAGLRESELCMVVGHHAVVPFTAAGHAVR